MESAAKKPANRVQYVETLPFAINIECTQIQPQALNGLCGDADSESVCAICLEPLLIKKAVIETSGDMPPGASTVAIHGEVHSTPCAHLFHSRCFGALIISSPTRTLCPLCRSVVSQKDSAPQAERRLVINTTPENPGTAHRAVVSWVEQDQYRTQIVRIILICILVAGLLGLFVLLIIPLVHPF